MTKLMTPSERLAAWMKIMGLNDRQLAEKTGVGVVHVWRMRTGAIGVTDSYAWKFAQVYGFDLARKLFDNQKEPA